MVAYPAAALVSGGLAFAAGVCVQPLWAAVLLACAAASITAMVLAAWRVKR